MMMYWWVTALAALGLARADIEADLDRIEDVFNMTDSVSPLEKDLSAIAPALFSLAEKDDPNDDIVKGMFIGPFVASALVIGWRNPAFSTFGTIREEDIRMNELPDGNIPPGRWTMRAERSLCTAASMLVLGKINMPDQAQRYAQCVLKGYLSSVFPRPDSLCIPSYYSLGVQVNRLRCIATTQYLAVNIDPALQNKLDTPPYWFQGRKDKALQPIYAHLNVNLTEKLLSNFLGYEVMMCLAPVIIFDRHCTAKKVIDDVTALVAGNGTNGVPQIVVDICKVLTLFLWGFLQKKPKSVVLREKFCLQHEEILDISGYSNIWDVLKAQDQPDPLTQHEETYLPMIFWGKRVPKDITESRNVVPVRMLQAVLWLLENDGERFEKGIKMAIMLGGANKEIAVVYSMLAGACYGFAAIPEEWRTTLYKCTFLEQIAVLLKSRRGVEERIMSASRTGFRLDGDPIDAELVEIGMALNKQNGPDVETSNLRDLAPNLFGMIDKSINPHVLDRIVGALLGLAVGDTLCTISLAGKKRDLDEYLTKCAEQVAAGDHFPPLPWTYVTYQALSAAASLIYHRTMSRYDQLQRSLVCSKGNYFLLPLDYYREISCYTNIEIKDGMRKCLTNFDTWRMQAVDQYIEDKNLAPWEMMIETNNYSDASLFFRGTTTKKYEALHDHLESKMGAFATRNNPENTPLLRVAAAAIFTFRGTLEHAIETARTICLLTHKDRETVDACKYYAFILWAALNGMHPDKFLFDPELFFNKQKHKLNLCKGVMKIALGSYRESEGGDGRAPAGAQGDGNMTAAATLKAALWKFSYDQQIAFNEKEKIFKLGGDPTTISAVYGVLAGICYGPLEVLDRLKKNEMAATAFIGNLAVLLSVAEGLTTANLPGILEGMSDDACEKRIAEAEKPSNPTKGGHKIPLIIAVCAGIALLLGGVVYIVIRKK